MTNPAGTSWPDAVRQGRLYFVGKPRRRPDRDGWWVSYEDPATGKRRQRKFTREQDAWTFSGNVESDRESLRCGRLSIEDIAIGRRGDLAYELVVDEYKTYLEKKKRSAKHVRETVALIKRFHRECGFKTPRQISAKRVDLWLESLPGPMTKDGTARGIASSETVNTYLRRVRAYCRWLEKAQIMAYSPVKNVEGVKAEDPRYTARALTFEELDRLLTCNEIAPYRRLWYALSARAGLRHNEIERLTWSDIDLGDGWLRIPGSKTKSNRAAELPLPDSLLARLREAKRADGRVVRYRPRARTWKRDVERAKIEPVTHAGHAYLKSLRRTYVTHLLLRTNGDVSTVKNLARHARVETTMRFYADPHLMDMAGAVAKLDPPKGSTSRQSKVS